MTSVTCHSRSPSSMNSQIFVGFSSYYYRSWQLTEQTGQELSPSCHPFAGYQLGANCLVRNWANVALYLISLNQMLASYCIPRLGKPLSTINIR
jgi:hypothetical protein